MNSIRVNNASANNLKNVCLTLKQGLFYVFAGPSGSGKSSLAFDVLYTEADRSGKARGIENIFRQTQLPQQVENLPEMTVGIEQQTDPGLHIAGIGWYSGLLHRLVLQKTQQKEQAGIWCQSCHGCGYIRSIDPDRVVRNALKPVTRGAFTAGVKMLAGVDASWWKAFCATRQLDSDTPFKQLPKPVQTLLLKGDGDDFPGFEPALKGLIGADALPKLLREEFPYYVSSVRCESCEGSGLSAPDLRRLAGNSLEI
ncbi:MAG: hypothetical protein GY862_16415, partial [Gammaproteobacteria bacterium]|nr:hypothetical protein [Gammaproteobacteria bacterium]